MGCFWDSTDARQLLKSAQVTHTPSFKFDDTNQKKKKSVSIQSSLQTVPSRQSEGEETLHYIAIRHKEG